MRFKNRIQNGRIDAALFILFLLILIFIISVKSVLVFSIIIITLTIYVLQRCYSYDTAGNRTQRTCSFFRIVDNESVDIANVKADLTESRSIENETVSNVTIVPNPASTVIEIVAEGFSKSASWTVVSQEGKIIMSGSLILGQKVDISHLQEGLYYLRINEGDKLVTKTFITTGN